MDHLNMVCISARTLNSLESHDDNPSLHDNKGWHLLSLYWRLPLVGSADRQVSPYGSGYSLNDTPDRLCFYSSLDF